MSVDTSNTTTTEEMKASMEEQQRSGIKGLLIAISYGATSSGMAFANKAVLSYYAYDYPFFIITCQMLFTILILELLRNVHLVKVESFSLSAGRELFLPSVLYAVNSVMSLSALSGMNIPIYGAVKRCTPVVIMALSSFVLKKSSPSQSVMVSVLMITAGCLLASYGDLQFDLVSYIYGFTSVICQALYLLLVQKAAAHRSALETLYLNSYITFPLLFLVSVASGQMSNAIHSFPDTKSLFTLVLVLVITMGCFLNFMLFWCTTYNSALTTSVTGAVKSIFQTVVGSFTFGGISHNLATFLGISLNLAGGVMYSLAKYVENRQKSMYKEKSAIFVTGAGDQATARNGDLSERTKT